MKLIIGLGNPGPEYANTRHNIGFMVLDNYLNADTKPWQNKFLAQIKEQTVAQEKVIFVKPQTFMNLSGSSVAKIVNFYKISPEDILVIQDDLDLPLGHYRLKCHSSSGGHNGIKSIIECLNTTDFARLKIGVSKNNLIATKDYVLGKFTSSELEAITSNYDTYNAIINDFINGYNINNLMNKYNGQG